MTTALLALDQGTTSSRAILFDATLAPVASGQIEFPQHYPAPGLVEHDAEDLWWTTLAAARDAIARGGISAKAIAAIGITNQRETTIVWDRGTGRPIHRAIVWQDRRTAERCTALRDDGYELAVSSTTGLLLDPYFSATKIAWILDHVDGARTAAEAGRLAFGTVDTWLLWRLTGGRVHATDASNASRTALYDIHGGQWDDALLRMFRVPRALLPEVRDSRGRFGETDPAIFGAAIPILGMAGDQQAATMGQACFAPGMMKATYGTGCFALLNTGQTAVPSQNRLLTTVAYQLDGVRTYALEGAIFIAGAAVQWLRDGLGTIATAADATRLAAAADPAQEVVLVPAFTGLGAPHWNPAARGAIFGLTRNAGPAELARAALMSVACQTSDLVAAARADWQAAGGATDREDRTVLRVDGGMAASDWTMQALADILDAPVDRPTVIEATARGAAWLAGSAAGLVPDRDGFAAAWQAERRFAPAMAAAERRRRLEVWQRAVAATVAFATPSAATSDAAPGQSRTGVPERRLAEREAAVGGLPDDLDEVLDALE
jgi:glycerol kinase